jgi:hypothetical protein
VTTHSVRSRTSGRRTTPSADRPGAPPRGHQRPTAGHQRHGSSQISIKSSSFIYSLHTDHLAHGSSSSAPTLSTSVFTSSGTQHPTHFPCFRDKPRITTNLSAPPYFHVARRPHFHVVRRTILPHHSFGISATHRLQQPTFRPRHAFTSSERPFRPITVSTTYDSIVPTPRAYPKNPPCRAPSHFNSQPIPPADCQSLFITQAASAQERTVSH